MGELFNYFQASNTLLAKALFMRKVQPLARFDLGLDLHQALCAYGRLFEPDCLDGSVLGVFPGCCRNPA